MAEGNVGIWGWDTANDLWRKLHVDALGNLQVDVLASALPAGAATAAHQVTTHGYIDGIEDLLGAGLPASLDTGHLRVREQNWPADYPLPAAQVATLQQVTEQGTPSVHLYGYDGAAWQTLLVESDVLKNLRVKLYDGANGIDSDLIDANIFVSGERALLVRAQVCGYNLEPFHQRRSDADALAAVSRELCQMNIALLYGYNGATYDRLRTYGTGILKVGRAEGGMSSWRGIANTTIKATPGAVYWITITSRDAANYATVDLVDGGVAGTKLWTGGVPAGIGSPFHAIFDLPLEFATDIYISLIPSGGGTTPRVTVGYL